MGRWGRASIFMNQFVRRATTIQNVPEKRNPNLFKHSTCTTSTRLFSALPSPAFSNYPDDDGDYDSTSSSHLFDSTHVVVNVNKIPVKAYFLSTSINLKTMQADNLTNLVPSTSRTTKFIVFRYRDSLPSKITDIDDEQGASTWRYMVVFHYGAAVLFNINDDEVESYLDIVRYYASGLLPEMKKDDYAVKEDPLLVADMQGGPDYIVLKNLDSDAIRIIGSVLAQSIALDHFVSQVDSMVEEFTHINRVMEKTGTFTMKRKKLFQLVGRANSSLADVILKVGIFDRSEIAWREAKYAQIFDYLREEYEVSQRFGNLDFKLKFVEHNIHFLQEVLQNRKSDLLEWCIIVLLIIENVISLYEIIRA